MATKVKCWQRAAGRWCMLLVPLIGSFVFTAPPAHAAACAQPTTDLGAASMTLTLPTTGTYRVWTRIMTPDTINNTYLLEIDGTTCAKVGGGPIPANSWVWVDYQDGTTTSIIDTNLTAGNHTVKLIGNQPNVKVDRVLFVTDTSCIPTGTGDNCAAVGNPAPPSVSITAPSDGAVVSGSTNVAISATDNSGANGVIKVELYANGSLKDTKSTAPYDSTWDTTTVPNGPYELVAKAYDQTGNASSATVNVTVKNGDTQPPSVPTGLKATANGPRRATLSWTASSDNVGVAGYKIIRNDAVVAQVGGSAATYTDTMVRPHTDYSYQVSAFDGAGNSSALSAVVNMTTPQVPDISGTPIAPRKLAATAASSSQVNLLWEDANDKVDVVSYDIYRSVDAGPLLKIATVTSADYGDTGLESNTQYSYAIVARSSRDKPSQPSQTAIVTTSAAPSPAGIIKGTAVDRNGKKIAGARISLSVNHVRYFASTNADGGYFISGLPAGTYTMRITAYGYSQKMASGKLSGGDTQIHNVRLTSQ